jgi:DNA-binding CsgD family transcriptional regulator
VKVAVVEPVTLYQEVLEWCVGVLAESDTDIELVDSASDPEVILSWERAGAAQQSLAHPAVRTLEVFTPDQKPIKSLEELRQQLTGSVVKKRVWLPPSISPDKPSAQELKVLSGVAEGLTSSEIGMRLGISTHTVDGHRRRLFRRWGVHSSLEAISLAKKHGFLVTGRG